MAKRNPRCLILLLLASVLARAEVPSDHIPSSLTLPSTYPESWVFVYTFHPVLGAYAIVDVAAQTQEYKGQFQGAFWPALIAPKAGSELYVAESFLERGTRGRRTDVLTVLDKGQLGVVTEIPLSAGKRNGIAGNIMDITHDETFMLLMNFTPASSVAVVDLKKRRLVNEVPIPGCTSIYPSGARSFSSLCQNGALVTFVLDDKGKVLREHRTAAFNDIDHDVLLLNPAISGAVTYFVTEKANVRPIELSDGEAKIHPTWPLLTPEQAADGWRPAAGIFDLYVAADASGRLYVRVYRETGYDKHQSANTEVWVYEPATQKRLRRIPLKNGGSSIEVTTGLRPYLVVVGASDTGAGPTLDVYEADTGTFVRSIGGWPPGTGLSLVQAKR